MWPRLIKEILAATARVSPFATAELPFERIERAEGCKNPQTRAVFQNGLTEDIKKVGFLPGGKGHDGRCRRGAIDRIQLTAATIIRDTHGIADIRGRKPHSGYKLKKPGKP